jgi:polar amino acid transport system permease protein
VQLTLPVTEPILHVRALRKSFGATEVLRGIDLEVAPQELVFIIGPSGSGKSTLLRCCNRLEEPTSGAVHLGGVDLMARATDINAMRRKIGMVFQSFNLYPHMTALGNVTLALRKVAGKSRAEAETLGLAALDRVGLVAKSAAYPGELSGGQQQRVAIARALALEPTVMLFDEPTSALDPGAGRLGARGDARIEGRRNDHAGGQPRNAVCARCCGSRDLHGSWIDRGRGAAGTDVRRAAGAAHPRLHRGADKVNAFLETFFKPNLIEQYLPSILRGVVTTVEIAFAVVVTGLVLGLLLAVIRSFQIKPANALIVIFVDMFRALPPLVIVLLVYFGLPNVGISIPSFAVLWLVLSLVLAAFAEEIFWAGILSVPKGQWEAARSTGLTFLGTLSYIVLPQAVRLTVPPITNRTVAITKNTALGMVIGVPEILNQATSAQSFSGNATPLMMGAIAYVLLFIPVVALGRFLETRFAWRRS